MSPKQNWQPISSLPVDKAVDIWVASVTSSNYGRRICHVAFVNNKWHGEKTPQPEHGEIATHWMPVPDSPFSETASEYNMILQK